MSKIRVKQNRKKQKVDKSGLSAAVVTNQLEKTQISKYHCKNGHGFSAEDANSISDRLKNRSVKDIGALNEKNGPDRIVNGIKIQTKYHKTPARTMNDAFEAKTGLFRYSNQQLEVPKDQYTACVKLMKKKIQDGKVPGASNPEHAEVLIRQGTVTYKQARNNARPGNIDSLKFDAKTQAVSSSYMFAISFAIEYAHAKWQGSPTNEAVERSIKSAISTGSATFITGIITAQVLRTKTAAIGTIAMRNFVKSLRKSIVGKYAINKLAYGSLGKPVYGNAAVNHLSKVFRSNAITGTVTTLVVSAPDFYRAAIKNNISWPQFTKNIIMNATCVGSGIGGAMSGAAVGSAFGPPGIIVGGIIGGVIFGTAGQAGSKLVIDNFIEDDAVTMINLVQKTAVQLAYEYMLSEKEIAKFSTYIKSTVNSNWLRDMYQFGNNGKQNRKYLRFSRSQLEPFCMELVDKRNRIKMPSKKTLQKEINKITKECFDEKIK